LVSKDTELYAEFNSVKNIAKSCYENAIGKNLFDLLMKMKAKFFDIFFEKNFLIVNVFATYLQI